MLFFKKLIAIVDTCSIKCSVSLARKKIRLDFQSMKVWRQETTNEKGEDAYPHKLRSVIYSLQDVRSSTNVCKLFAFN